MITYAVRRLLGSVPVVLIGVTLTFFLIYLAPGDPTLKFLDPSLGAPLQAQIAENFGLNRPVHVQYLSWLGRVVGHFDFGHSFRSGRPASRIVLTALPPTILVTGLGLLGGLILGMAGGIVSALLRGKRTDRWVTAVMLFFYSMPAFWLGMILLGLFALKLQWLPAAHLTSVFHDQLTPLGKAVDTARHIFLPVVTLSLISAAAFGRYVRSGLIEAMASDYVLAARARGVPQGKLVLNYGIRNALIPLITVAGMTFPVLFSGAVVIEVISPFPGWGG
ncbi:MAG: ABC transporter permease [Fidelibacterota bacterium]